MSESEQKIDENKLTEGLCDTEETCKPTQKEGVSEDWLALWLGLLIFALSLGVFWGGDLLGWGAKMGVWVDPAKAISIASKAYAPTKGQVVKVEGQKVTIKGSDGKESTVVAEKDISSLKPGDTYEKSGTSGLASIFYTFLFMLLVMTFAAAAMRANIPRFMIGFSVIFWLSILCWFSGHFAYIAATKNEVAKFNIPWALSLTGEFGFIIALVVGLIIGNFFPKFTEWLKEAARPELFIKTGIVIMGAGLGLKAAESFSLATNIMFRGFCAIVEAYLIYWALTYYIARKYFKFSREWSAPLASGISICGVSAAIATGGAIRARPIVPIMVSSLVVIFVAIEMIILPFMAQVWLWTEPLVAGAWMGLAVKSDGGAIASGAITDALIRAKTMDMTGVKYAEGWITMTATTVKMFIDIFIGVWSFLLAIIWCAKIECQPGQKVRAIEIWNRFPKFVIGYALTLVVLLLVCWPASRALGPADKEIQDLKQQMATVEKQLSTVTDDTQKLALQDRNAGFKKQIAEITNRVAGPQKTMTLAKLSTDEGNVFRVFFFLLTFFAIGLVSNFKKLMEEGIGKLAAVYVVCLFGFIIWIGLFISWLFFHGVLPPVITG
jgi:uncharacterized membrane protein YadS